MNISLALITEMAHGLTHVIDGGGGRNGLPVYIVVKQDVEFPQVLASS